MNISRRWMFSVAVAAVAVSGLAGTDIAMAQSKAAKPLKITVYGGSGNIGSRIVNEAAARGHTVTVVDRSPKPVTGPHAAHVKVVQGDAMDAKDIAKNIAGQDVVVSSVIVRPTPTPDFSLKIVQAMVEAQRATTGTKPRLLIVGGASSLNNATGTRIVDTLPATLPEGTMNEIRSSVASLDYIRTVTDTPWTFLSPASSIAPGTRTGKFRLGTDQLVVDAQGRSAISMEDFAVAMLDEIEKPQYANKRFTVGY